MTTINFKDDTGSIGGNVTSTAFSAVATKLEANRYVIGGAGKLVADSYSTKKPQEEVIDMLKKEGYDVAVSKEGVVMTTLAGQFAKHFPDVKRAVENAGGASPATSSAIEGVRGASPTGDCGGSFSDAPSPISL